jgi:hypothetical protein
LVTHCEALTGTGCGGGTDALRAMPRDDPVEGAGIGLAGNPTGMICADGGRTIGAGGRTG